MNPLIIAAAVSAVIGFGAAWQVQAWRQDAAELERIEAVQQINRENAALSHRTSTTFEKARTKNETRTRTITVEVDKIIERPVFRNVCIDADGVRLVNSQIRRDTATGQPGRAVPGPAAAE